MGATCRPNCGACCDPVTIPYSQAEAIELGEQGRLDPHHVWWVTHILEPMRPRDARDIAPYLFTPAMKAAVGPEPNDVLTFYYRCSWFDRETRTCTHYDERPTVCQGYPWHYFGHPVENAALPPVLVQCGHRPSRRGRTRRLVGEEARCVGCYA